MCPCLIAVGRLWCVRKKRYANTKEWAKLQGFPVNFKQVVSKTQFKKQMGNTMSVNVIRELLKCLIL
jgi:site-specific DNA-cytosine methylase